MNNTITETEKIRFLSDIFGDCSVSRDGKNVAVSCPECGDKEKKKLSVRLDNWQFHCWVCGSKGRTLVPMLRKHSAKEVLSYYREKFLGSTLSKSDAPAEIEESITHPEGFKLIAECLGSRDPDVKACISYLKTRGIGIETMWRFRLGVSNIGRHRRRVIMPSFDSDGDLNYFVSRTIDGSFPKYLNCKANKTKIVFNDIDVDWDKELTVCEGPFDLMKCDQNATCLLGSNLGEDTLLFKKIVANETDVLLALDADMRTKTQKIAASLASYGCKVRILELGERKDIGEMDLDEFLKAKNEAKDWKPRDLIMHKIGLIRSASLL